jgi:hypothetical protein
MGWMLFFMLIVLKIPLAAAGWLIWYAIKAEPELDDEPASGADRGPRRKLPPRPPRRPRRGPVGGGAGCKVPPCAQEAPTPLTRQAPAIARRS